MNKLFLILFDDSTAYMQEVCYTTYQERYELTKGIDPKFIFDNVDEAIKKLVDLNSI